MSTDDLDQSGKRGSTTLKRGRCESIGAKTMNKEHRTRVDHYQQLIYCLQTSPRYLACLLNVLPLDTCNKFMSNTILNLFNYGAGVREEYWLIRMLELALKEEIR